MQCFTCRKDIPLGSSCWPITNRTHFRISSPPTVCDDCFKCSVCRAQLTLDRYGSVGNVLYCVEHEPPGAGGTSSSTPSFASSPTVPTPFSFSPSSSTSSPSAPILPISSPPFLPSPPFSPPSGAVSPTRTSPRRTTHIQPWETSIAEAPNWLAPTPTALGSSTTSSANSTTAATSPSTPPSNSSTSSLSNVFTLPAFTPGAAGGDYQHGRSVLMTSAPSRRNTGTALKGRTARQTLVSNSSANKPHAANGGFSSSPFQLLSLPGGYAPAAAPPASSASSSSSMASSLAPLPATSLSASTAANPSTSPRPLRHSDEPSTFSKLSPSPTEQAPAWLTPASFSALALSAPRSTWPPPPTRARPSDPVRAEQTERQSPEGVNTDSEPNSLVDKRKRRTPKRTSTHRRNTSGLTATVAPDDASGGLETRLKQLAAQLEMVRLEKAEEREDVGSEAAKPHTMDEEVALLRARLTAATRKADQAEARADQAEERAARYKAHAEMMQQVVDNTLKALHNVEAVTREMSKLQRKLASAKEERAEMAAQVEEYRKRAEHLTKRDEERAKELNKLKGNFSPRDYTIEELIQLEGTLEEGKKKVNEVRVALQVSAEEKKKKECVLCFDEQKDTVFIPCGHLACCRSCSKQVSKCPICRKSITHTVPVYDC